MFFVNHIENNAFFRAYRFITDFHIFPLDRCSSSTRLLPTKYTMTRTRIRDNILISFFFTADTHESRAVPCRWAAFLNNVRRINFSRERPDEQTNENIINFHASWTKSRILCAAQNQNKFRPCNLRVHAAPDRSAYNCAKQLGCGTDPASRLIALNATRSFRLSLSLVFR